MIHAVGWMIKLTLFSILVLVLGNYVHWNGKSVSDQVKTQLAHAERSQFAGSIRRWTGNVTRDAKRGAHLQKAAVLGGEENRKRSEGRTSMRSEERPQEKIQASERQKLRALIQELNTTKSADRRGTH
jgi:hypothetical protein